MNDNEELVPAARADHEARIERQFAMALGTPAGRAMLLDYSATYLRDRARSLDDRTLDRIARLLDRLRADAETP